MRYLYCVLIIWCGSVLAEPAITTRSTELKAQPASDAATLATLPEKEKIETIKRQGAWVQVKSADGKTGWLRMLSLRLGNNESQKTTSGLGSLLGFGRNNTTGGTVTTGVRGLSEEDLENAKPNPAELEKMEKFSVNKAQAKRFAASAKLQSQDLEYLAPATKSEPPQQGESWKKGD